MQSIGPSFRMSLWWGGRGSRGMLPWKVAMEKDLIFSKLGYQILVRLDSKLELFCIHWSPWRHSKQGQWNSGRTAALDARPVF